MFYFLFLFSYIYSTNAQNLCFQVKENYKIENETTLTIKGKGGMCKCFGNEFDEIKSTIEIIKFDDYTTSIGQRCFEQFTKIKSIEFSQNITTIESYAFYQSHIQKHSKSQA